MKKLIVLTCTLSLLTACGDSIEKKAGEKLAAARAAFEHNDYNEAKLQIDSIKILYPKAFDTRKEGIKLMQQVETERATGKPGLSRTACFRSNRKNSKRSRTNILREKRRIPKNTVTTLGLPRPYEKKP